MKIETRKEMVEVNKTIYIAADGTECPTEQSCKNYEEQLRIRNIRDEVMQVPHTVCLACAVEYADDNEYRNIVIFQPRDQCDILKINRWLEISDGSDCVINTSEEMLKCIDGGICFLIYDDSFTAPDELGTEVWITRRLGTIAEWKQSYADSIDAIVNRIGG